MTDRLRLLGRPRRRVSEPSHKVIAMCFRFARAAHPLTSERFASSRGPGTAMEWALQIVGMLAGETKRNEVAGPMML